ncbi:MAG TPA: penicillin-binding protein 2 [Actinobacteria bacterium]|nr:penicillin-binding protein 2 [Actinomycetota bacterium]
MRRPAWRWHDLRVVVLGLAFAAAWAGIGVRIYQVQAVDAARFAQRGFDQRVRHEVIPAPRGTIYARDGVELAISVAGADLVADPSIVDDAEEVASLLDPLLELDAAEIVERLEGDGRYARLARGLEPDAVEELEALIDGRELLGLTLVPRAVRVYPSGPLAAQVVGLTRLDTGAGIEGLEASLDDVLAGQDGRRIVERDPGGRVIPQGRLLVDPAVPGADVVTTLDRRIQYAAEQAISAAVERTGANWGTVVVLDPDTGEVLAMASAPGFDPNDRDALDPDAVVNRAVAEVYEPGSTLKVVTIAAALEEGLVAPSTELEVPQRIVIEPKEYTDPSDHPSTMTVAEIVERSSNVGTILVQRMLGNERHYRYLDAFGLGRRAAIDFPGERSGHLEHVSAWCRSTCGPSAAIGYGVSVTPLQMAALYATIANDGEWVEPHVVAEIVEADGRRIVTEPRRRRVLAPETARLLRSMLERVVEGGTGTRARVEGFTVAGKTGTTEKYLPDEQTYSTEDRIASFVGMAPAGDPEIVVAVVLDSPKGVLEDGTELKYGGASAAPVFAEVALAVLNDLGIPPDRPGVDGDG